MRTAYKRFEALRRALARGRERGALVTALGLDRSANVSDELLL